MPAGFLLHRRWKARDRPRQLDGAEKRMGHLQGGSLQNWVNGIPFRGNMRAAHRAITSNAGTRRRLPVLRMTIRCAGRGVLNRTVSYSIGNSAIDTRMTGIRQLATSLSVCSIAPGSRGARLHTLSQHLLLPNLEKPLLTAMLSRPATRVGGPRRARYVIGGFVSLAWHT